MNKNKELVKNTIIIFINQLREKVGVVYTHFLSTEDYGYIDLIQTYLTFFIPLILLKIDAGIFRFLIDARKSEEEKNKIITNGIFIMFVELIISTILFAVAVKIFSIKYSILIVMNLISLSVLTFLLQIVRGIGKNKQYSFSSIIAAIVTIVLNLIFLVGFHKNGKYVLIASLISNIICTIYLLIVNKILKNVKIKYIDKKLIKDLLKYSIPMIPNELSWWIVHVSDRTIISYALGVAANGIYSVSCKFSNILSSIFNIFNLSWQESAALHINDTDKDEFFSNVINKVFNLFICFCIGILACLPFVFELLIKDSYREAYKYVPILLLANIFSVLIGLIGSIYVAKKMTKEVAKTTMIAAIINLTIDIALIKVIGIYAAAISTLVSYMLLAIYRYIDVQKYVKVKIPIKNIVVNSIIFILVVVLYLYNNIALNVINLLLCILYAIIVNKELLIEFKKVIGKKVKNIN